MIWENIQSIHTIEAHGIVGVRLCTCTMSSESEAQVHYYSFSSTTVYLEQQIIDLYSHSFILDSLFSTNLFPQHMLRLSFTPGRDRALSSLLDFLSFKYDLSTI